MKYLWAMLLALTVAATASLPTGAAALSLPYTPPIIDNSDAQYFDTNGEWSHFPLAGFEGNFVFSEPATATGCHHVGSAEDTVCTARATLANSATWIFPYVVPGKYQVWTTWVPYPNLATDATYNVYHKGNFYEKKVNQQKKPSKKFDNGRWQKLGTFDVSGELKVLLTNVANGYVAADAVRIEYIGPADPLPECSDGIDNDGDNLRDFPDDPDCESKKDDSESNAKVSIRKEGPDVIRPNEPVTYTMTIKNNYKKTLRKLRVVDATFVTNGMKLVPEKSSPECELGANGSAIKCGPYKLRRGQSKVITLTGIAPDYSCSHPDVSNTAAVQLRTLETTDSSTHTADVQCVPVCGNLLCEEGEADHFDPGGCGLDASPECLGPPGVFVPGSCPSDCIACPVYDVVAPPPGCFYEWIKNEFGCEEPNLVCEPTCGNNICEHNEGAYACDPYIDHNGNVAGCEGYTYCPEDCGWDIDPTICPVYDMSAPGPGCHYENIKDEEGCDVPHLVCDYECGNGICEDPETPLQCITDSIGTEPEGPIDCPDTVFCPQDCQLDIIPLPHPCPVYSLIEPPEGCKYIWHTNDNGCEEPELVCKDTCGNGICELSESCQGTCTTTDTGETVCTDSCGPEYCAQDCAVEPVPHVCPDVLLVEPEEGCYYIWDQIDEYGCNIPQLVCEEPTPIGCTDDAQLCPDGSYVSRNAANNCAFDPCPSIIQEPLPLLLEGVLRVAEPEDIQSSETVSPSSETADDEG